MNELEQAREIIRDILEERGLPQWLANIATEREVLVRLLRETPTDDDGDAQCCGGGFYDCTPLCERLRLLRALDPDETQRQADEAHADALQEDMHRRPRSLPIRRDAQGYACDSDGNRVRASQDIHAGKLVALTPRGIEHAGAVQMGALADEDAPAGEWVRVTTSGVAWVRVQSVEATR